MAADRNAVIIALTGTPLIGDGCNTKDVFGEYIVEDFKHSRIALGDSTIGGMIVCDSSPQAVQIEEELDKYQELPHELIRYDVEDKETRRGYQEDFKKGEIDLLVVYDMLLIGIDAPRLKKLYRGRVFREHNLLQTLTHVNHPYKTFHYGRVVDFADIRNEFGRTNKAYQHGVEEEETFVDRVT